MAALLGLLAAGLSIGCRACPPGWADAPRDRPGMLVAAGHSGPVFVEAVALDVALARAARVLADRLGLDVERRLSVHESGGRLFVEAVGGNGPVHALDRLQLLERRRCGDDTHVLVGLAVP